MLNDPIYEMIAHKYTTCQRLDIPSWVHVNRRKVAKAEWCKWVGWMV